MDGAEDSLAIVGELSEKSPNRRSSLTVKPYVLGSKTSSSSIIRCLKKDLLGHGRFTKQMEVRQGKAAEQFWQRVRHRWSGAFVVRRSDLGNHEQ